MLRALRPHGLRAAIGFVLPSAILIGWQAGGRFIPQDLLPAPSAVLHALSDMAWSGELLANLTASLRRLTFGYCLGAVFGTVLGLLTGGSDVARRLIDPTIQALRAVPSVAWVPPFVLWFGIMEMSKVYLIALGAFFPIYLNLMAGMANVDRKLIELGQILTLTRLQRCLLILLPASLPSYAVGLRGGLALAWMFVAAAELMGASDGVGFLLMDAEQTGRPERVLAAILMFALCGRTTDWLLRMSLARMAGASLHA